jgi:hypothetical protein
MKKYILKLWIFILFVNKISAQDLATQAPIAIKDRLMYQANIKLTNPIYPDSNNYINYNVGVLAIIWGSKSTERIVALGLKLQPKHIVIPALQSGLESTSDSNMMQTYSTMASLLWQRQKPSGITRSLQFSIGAYHLTQTKYHYYLARDNDICNEYVKANPWNTNIQIEFAKGYTIANHNTIALTTGIDVYSIYETSKFTRGSSSQIDSVKLDAGYTGLVYAYVGLKYQYK